MVEPSGAVAGGARELDGGVQGEEEQQGGGRRGVGGDEFEPGEGEEPGRGGPQPEPGGQGAPLPGSRRSSQAARWTVRSGLTSRQTGPRRSEAGTSPTQRSTYTAPGGRVALRVVRPEEQVEHDGQPGGEPQGAQGGTGGPGVGEALDGGRDRTARPVAAEPRGGPEQAEREEGDEERGEGSGEGVEGGQRQVVLGADAVGEGGHRTTSWVRSSPDPWVSTSKSPLRSAVKVRVAVRPAGRRAALS